MDDDGCENIEQEIRGLEKKGAKDVEEEDPKGNDGETQTPRKSMRGAPMPRTTLLRVA